MTAQTFAWIELVTFCVQVERVNRTSKQARRHADESCPQADHLAVSGLRSYEHALQTTDDLRSTRPMIVPTVLHIMTLVELCHDEFLAAANVVRRGSQLRRYRRRLTPARRITAGVRAGWSLSGTSEGGEEQRRNARAGETVDPRENPPTSGIVRHDYHARKSGSSAARNRTRFALVG
ncbi:hypothetical protein PR048_004548 [Dryococelus australis]|uniref:Uncharacterized protein n=1 Tax=Dryococelus australis TaxID=614101 RepID=A0ABQ9I7N6_9NEOP|nr:hypothetical protein PR048_004548 [Dryococelus australis]